MPKSPLLVAAILSGLLVSVSPVSASTANTDNHEYTSPMLITKAQAVEIHSIKQSFDYLGEKQLNDGRIFIRIDTALLKKLKPGNTFSIAITDQGERVTGTIEKEQSFEGIRRLSGYFTPVSLNRKFPLSITLSSDDSYVAANFSLENSDYTLEAKNGLGWMNNMNNEELLMQTSEIDMPH
ncbi:hypothetical protein [Rahnella sp. NRRL B-41462]|uniref:hypothetical protein n=1 Tax=Rahnella sp. NRRL B-41462 TaxID=1610579 RepID=UPI000DD2EAE4|nr:hypothetical protein [Rahnella sp. NRRL B-41462]